MFKKFKKIIVPLLITFLLFSIVVMGTPTYVNVGPTTDFEGDVGVPDGSGYYISDVLFSTLGLIDISTLEKTDGGIIVGDGTNFVLETGITARTSLGLGNVENLKVKLDATTAPGVSNDNTEGYAIGSRWIDITNDKEYVALDVSTGAAVWIETTVVPYTNLTSFVDQTAWRVFYSDGEGNITELPLGTDGTYLKSTGVTSAPEFNTPPGAGDMNKSTYDADDDGDIDVAAGGTEKSSWTLYAIPYLSGTTAFGEIAIGTAEYALTVNATEDGYDWTLFDLSLYYLKTEVDTLLGALTYSDVGAEQADAGLTSLAGLTYVSDSFIKVTATDTYTIRTYAEVKDDLDLVIGTDILAQQTIGIANDNLVEMDDTDAAVDDYCKLTANGIVGRSYSEVKTDLGIDLTLYYLKTEMDSFSKLQAIISDKTLINEEDAITLDNDLNMGTHKIIGVVDPVNPQEAATKAYADTKVATEVDPTVDTDAEIKAILVDEVTKTGTFTAGRLPEINNSTGIIEQSDIEHKANGGYDFNANSAGFTTQTATGDGTTTCDWRTGLKFRFLFGAQNETFTFTNPEFSCHLQIIMIQDGTGSWTATWPAGIYWATGTEPALSTSANARDIVNFFFDDYDDVYYGMGIDFAIP